MKTVTLTVNNNTFTLISDSEGMFNLNRIHQASGIGPQKRPSLWLRNQQAIDFINQFLEAQISATKIKRGRGVTGTWGIEQVVYAYASWISADFHAAVIEAFRHAVNCEGDKAVETAQSIARTDGIIQRKLFVSQLGKHGASRGDYSNMTDTVNIAVLGSASSTLKEEKGLKKSDKLRDHLSEEDLVKLTAVEAIATMFLTLNKEKGRGVMREAVHKATERFKSLM